MSPFLKNLDKLPYNDRTKGRQQIDDYTILEYNIVRIIRN